MQKKLRPKSTHILKQIKSKGVFMDQPIAQLNTFSCCSCDVNTFSRPLEAVLFRSTLMMDEKNCWSTITPEKLASMHCSLSNYSMTVSVTWCFTPDMQTAYNFHRISYLQVNKISNVDINVTWTPSSVVPAEHIFQVEFYSNQHFH